MGWVVRLRVLGFRPVQKGCNQTEALCSFQCGAAAARLTRALLAPQQRRVEGWLRDWVARNPDTSIAPNLTDVDDSLKAWRAQNHI